ncbi:hypothetical protein DSM104299_00257 [Baekduia alba]|uniref:hypothetical protein n=1 Tax=Baekduia alba TaxID=2997333 RepID=UPI0023401A21|nr:hypothetical protein [Baekduia alba]WCB91586.1 hypothetical protein DSM104299_00257 [Baekduia alba]
MVADEAATDTATGAAADAADAVASTSVLVEEGATAIPELCSTAVLCPASLAIGAFGAGYVIGTGAKALYLKFFGGDDPNTDTNIDDITWQRYTGPGDYQIASATGPVVHRGEYYLQWVEQNPFGYNFFNYAWHGATTDYECRFGIQQPHNVIVRTGTTPYRCSNNPPQPIEAYIRTPEMFMSHHRPPAPAGSTDTTGSTSSPRRRRRRARTSATARHRFSTTPARPSCASGWSTSCRRAATPTRPSPLSTSRTRSRTRARRTSKAA